MNEKYTSINNLWRWMMKNKFQTNSIIFSLFAIMQYLLCFSKKKKNIFFVFCFYMENEIQHFKTIWWSIFKNCYTKYKKKNSSAICEKCWNAYTRTLMNSVPKDQFERKKKNWMNEILIEWTEKQNFLLIEISRIQWIELVCVMRDHYKFH